MPALESALCSCHSTGMRLGDQPLTVLLTAPHRLLLREPLEGHW